MRRLFLTLIGWVRLILDTLIQRLLLRSVPRDHPVFDKTRRVLAGKSAVVTGANTGLGFETARWLARAGASVVLACRSLDKAETAMRKIIEEVPDAKVDVMQLDLASLGSVRGFARSFVESGRALHILILNAGIMAVPRVVPEAHYMVNHVGHALLALLMLPLLHKCASDDKHGRIVVVSSMASLIADLRLDDLAYERRRYRPFEAYANSKLCNILFTKALSKRLSQSNIDVNAVHPGEAYTDVARHMVGDFLLFVYRTYISKILLTARESAMTSVYLAAADELEGESGEVYHMVNRKLLIPEYLRRREYVERLWSMTLRDASVSREELSVMTNVFLCSSGSHENKNMEVHT